MTVTLITGANKGLGYETARQLIERGHTVYLGARDVERGEAAASGLGGQSVQLDVTDDSSVEAALGVIAEREGRLDVLVNNAGISTAADVTGPMALKVFDTNAIGLVRVTQAALPLLISPRTQWWSTSRAPSARSGPSQIQSDANFTSQASSMAQARPPSRCSLFSMQRHSQESSSMPSSPASPPPTSLRSAGPVSRLRRARR